MSGASVGCGKEMLLSVGVAVGCGTGVFVGGGGGLVGSGVGLAGFGRRGTYSLCPVWIVSEVRQLAVLSWSTLEPTLRAMLNKVSPG